MRTKANGQSLKSLQKDATAVFSSIDNQQCPSPTRIFKSIQSDIIFKKKSKVLLNKENRNSHAFITSSYDTPSQQQHHNSRPFYKHVPHTFTTSVNHDRVLPTTQRPTMGGKTISAIHHLPASTAMRNPNRMSSEELKLLSRRIDPHEPLASPHASPTKPPLPSLSSSRKRQRSSLVTHQEVGIEPPIKVQKTVSTAVTTEQPQPQQFVCEPCNKKYKTRNGYTYHIERCKYLRFESTIAKTIIQCICQEEPTIENNGTMIECISCSTWLHMKCVGPVTDETSFRCPRCSAKKTVATAKEEEQPHEEDHAFSNGDKTVKLSELCQAKEQDTTTKDEMPNEFNFISLFSDDNTYPTSHHHSPVLQSWEDDFNGDWNNDVPSLLFSDSTHPGDSMMDDLPSSDLSMSQSDWLHFANFEVDFHIQDIPEDE